MNADPPLLPQPGPGGGAQPPATAGGYGPYAPVDPESKAVFDRAMSGRVGATYQPIAVSKQVVAGLNYSFIANRTIVVPGATPQQVVVKIYQPLGGAVPQVVSISPYGSGQGN